MPCSDTERVPVHLILTLKILGFTITDTERVLVIVKPRILSVLESGVWEPFFNGGVKVKNHLFDISEVSIFDPNLKF